MQICLEGYNDKLLIYNADTFHTNVLNYYIILVVP